MNKILFHYTISKFKNSTSTETVTQVTGVIKKCDRYKDIRSYLIFSHRSLFLLKISRKKIVIYEKID